MARLIRIAILMTCILFAGRAYAAGGACPSGANYTNPADANGPLVTLASLGVKNCYYVAASGSDSNSGTSEGSPWLHAPQMPNCSSNCATVQSGGVPPGTGIILRGGDTWHFGNSGASPYTGGSWNFNSGQTPDGTSANPIYAGVDQSWFSGGAWTRPILNGDNPLSTSAVGSCAYQIGSVNEFIILDARKYIIVDNFELTGLCQQKVGQPGHYDVYFSYGSAGGPVYFLNNYVHGDTHVPFAGSNGSPSCTGSNVCFNISVFEGSASGGEIVAKNVIDMSDSEPVGTGLCKGGFANVSYNVFLYTSQCITVGMHLFHDNLYGNFYENGHSNVLESNNVADASGTNAVYNNVFFQLETAGPAHGGVALWPSPPVGTTDYFFNNLMYAVGQMEVFNVGQNGLNQGAIVVFNNTFQINSGQGFIFGCQSHYVHPFTAVNNLYIVDGTAYSTPCSGLSDVTNLSMSNSTAKSKGFTASQNYAYSPTSSSSPTAGTGTNNATFCSALSIAASNLPTLSDAALACQSDTSYACTYATSSHTVSCPSRTVVARPMNTAWDKGAYQSSGTQASGPNPPSNLTATVNP
jgi:hypothetical protein